MKVGRLELEMAADIARLSRDMDQARGMVGRFGRDVDRVMSQVRTAFAGLGVGLVLRELVQVTDQYAKYTAQLRLATKSEEEYAAARERVRSIAQSSMTDLAATGTLYARISNATRELGKTQDDVGRITEAVTLSLRVSGATQQEAASATLQLSQAFGAGALRGEEFNAVNEAAPRLMKALADGMGVPIGSLRELAKEGKITAAVMAEALPLALIQLQREAAQIETIGGHFTNLKNTVLELVGAEAEAAGLTKMLGLAMAGAAKDTEPFRFVLKGLIEAIRAVAVFGGNVAFVLRGIGLEIGGLAAQAVAFFSGDFKRAAEIGRQMKADAEANRKAFDEWEKAMMATGDAAKGAAKSLGELDQVERRMLGEGQARIRQIMAETEEKKRQEEANKALAKERERLRKEDIAGWIKYIEALQAEDERRLLAEAKIQDEINRRRIKENEETLRQISEGEKQHAKEVAEAQALGAKFVLEQDKLRLEESRRQWGGFFDGIESAFRDGFNNIGRGWKGALEAMRDAFKRTLLDFIYQSFAKPFILNIVGNVAGMLGLNGLQMAARGAAGGTNALNIGSTLLSGANFLTGGTAGAFISGMSLPTSAVGASAINAGVGVSATSAAGMGAQFAAMMTNPVTIAIAAAAALAYFFRDKGENWTGQIGFGTNARAYASEGPFGRQGFVSLQGNDATNRAIQAFMASTTAIDRIIAATLNRSQIDQVIANLAAPYATRNDGSPAEFAFGKDDDTAPEQLTLEFLQAKYGRVFDVVDATFARFIREYKGTAEELIREISAFAGVLQGLKGLGLNGLDADALRAMQREGETLAQTLERVGGGWLQLVEAFTSDQTKLANAQKEVDALFSDLRAAGIDLPATREGWLDVMRGLDLSTASGRALFERMLKLAPAFALVTDAAAAAVDAISGIARRAAGNALGFGRSGENTSVRIGANISALSDAVRDNTVATEANTDANFSGVYGLTPAQVARNREIEAARKLAEAFEEARRAVAKYRADLLLDPNLSTLDPAQQLRISVDQFYQAWARAMAGDLGAIKDLPGLADIVLDLARTNYASDPRYVELFDWVRNMLGQVADAPAGENFNEKMLGYTERHVEIAEGTLNMLLNIRDNANANTAQLTAAVNGVAAAVRQTTDTVPR